MKAAAFTFHRPTDLAEAVALLAEHGALGKIIAGGQSLVPTMNFRLARPETLIDINAIGEIQGLTETEDTLVIGAVTRHAVFEAPVCAGPTGRLLARVVHNVSHYPIRRRGTFGGSLAHADPASEWCLMAAAFGAEMEILGPEGARRVAAPDYFRGTFTTAVAEDEILVRVHLPKLAEGWGTGFFEFSRRKGDFALAMAVAALRLESGSVREARLGAGALAPTPLRLVELEPRLQGAPATREALSEIAAGVAELVDPPSDIHGSSDYRRELAVTVVRRALFEALDDAAT